MADYRYVQRNGQGAIIASFAVAQPGIAEEALSADDPALTPAPVVLRPSPREWLERLSPTTQAAVSAAAIANASIFLWLLKASGSTAIDVTLPETITGVAALVAAGVLTSADQVVLLAP